MTESSQLTRESRARYDLEARSARLDVSCPTVLVRAPYETLHQPHIERAV